MAAGPDKRRAALTAVGVALLLFSSAGAQTARPPFGALVEQVQALFPVVAGEVIEVQGRQVTLSLGRRDGLLPGIDLSLYREGRDLRHPRTGQVLGRTEQPLGRVSVTQAFESYSVATLAEQRDVKPGDRARLSSGKLRLGLLALSSGLRDRQVEAAVQELTEELSRSGRFQVTSGDAVGVRLARAGIRPDEAIEGKGLDGAARQLGADYLLAILFKRVERKPYMEVRVFADGRAPLLTTALFVPPVVKPPAEGQFSADSRGGRPAETPKRRSLLARLLTGDWEGTTYSSGESTIPLREIARFPFPVLAMDVATAPVDGQPRIVVTDGQRVYQYRIAGTRLDAEWTFNARTMGRVISIQFVDLDGDGVLEVAGNRWDPKGGLNSFIVTAKSGRPEYLADDLDSILFAVDAAGRGVKHALWAQRLNPDKFFTTGQADEVAVENERLKVIRAVQVHSNFRATGATFASLTAKDRRILVFVDPHNRLQVDDNGQDLWRSSSMVGGGYAVIEIVKQLDQAGRHYFYRMEPTPLAVDLDGDGVDEVVVPQNVVKEGLLAVIFRGPAGFRLQSVESGFEGPITAVGAFHSEAGAQPTLLASVVRFTGLLRESGETQIIMTIPQE
ncbi:MAG: hypothetical protein ACREK6_01155 [Candidatus Rokuibacteriota bacterium]